MRTPRSILKLAVPLTLSFAASLSAQELLKLDQFDDGDDDGWYTNGPDATVSVASNDGTDCAPDSDSLLATQTAPQASSSRTFLAACVNGIVAGQTYTVGGLLRFPTGQTATGSALFELDFVANFGCSGTLLDIVFSVPTVPTTLAGNWIPSAGSGVAPAGANSAQIRVELEKVQAGDSLAVRVDSVYLTLGEYVFAEDQEIGNPCRWTETNP